MVRYYPLGGQRNTRPNLPGCMRIIANIFGPIYSLPFSHENTFRYKRDTVSSG